MSLAALPSELVAMICEDTNKRALLALRLTDRRISALATMNFSKRFVDSFAVLMTAQSLERLVAICEHPVFGPAVRMIHVTFSRVHEDRVTWFEEERNWLIKVNDTTDTIDEISRMHHKLQCCKRRRKAEVELEKSGKAVELLTRAFAALETYRTWPSLMICSDDVRLYDKLTLLGCDCHLEENSISESHIGSTFQTCLEAIRRSRMDFPKLYWYMDKKPNDLAEMDFNLDDFSDREMNVFKALDAFIFEPQWRVPDSVLLSIANVLKHAPKLLCFRLKHYNRFGSRGSKPSRTPSKRFEMGDDALRAVRSNELCQVNFSNMAFSRQSLLDFLDHHRGTLTHVGFAKCTLRNGTWIEIISYIKDNLPLLESLDLSYLYDTGPQTPKESYLTHEPAVLGMGRTKVKRNFPVQLVLQAILQCPLKDPTGPGVFVFEGYEDDDDDDLPLAAQDTQNSSSNDEG